MKKISFIAVLLGFFTPAIAFAQFGGLNSFLTSIINFINGVLVPLVFAVAFLVFIWGVFQYFVLKSSDEEGRENARNLMLYGLIGFFVMMSVWGIVNLLVEGVGLTDQSPKFLPDAPTSNK